jgi:hypothetical protein
MRLSAFEAIVRYGATTPQARREIADRLAPGAAAPLREVVRVHG